MSNKLPEYVEFQYFDKKGKLHSLGTARTDSIMVHGRQITAHEIRSIINSPANRLPFGKHEK